MELFGSLSLKSTENLTRKYEQRKQAGKDVGLPVYAAMIEAMDNSVGKVLNAVDELGLANDTLILFTSDNGGVRGLADNGSLKFGKGWPYEGGVRVPLIVKWPGKIAANSKSDLSVVNTDFFPTFLDAANVTVPEALPLVGESLMPIFTDSGELKRDAIYFHYPNYAWHADNRLGGAIIEGDFKLLNWYDDDSVELYNLRQDPFEANDLSKLKPELSQKLKLKFKAWLKESKAAMPLKHHKY